MKRHRVLIIGVGSIGERHARCMLRTDRADVGICELNNELRKEVANRYGIAEAFASLEDALAQSWDTAVVATPAPYHVDIARRLIAAGVAPFIEKPLAVDEDGIPELIAEASEQPAGVAYVYRAHPAVIAMRDALHGGDFGRPLQVVVNSGQNFPTYRSAYASTYYRDRAAGGGAIQDALTHWFNCIEWLVGPTTRIAVDACHLALPDVDVEDTVHAMARNGSVMTAYTLSQHQSANEHTISVVCEHGVLVFDLHRHCWRAMGDPDTPWQTHEASFKDRDDWFTQQEMLWLDTVEGRRPPQCSLADAAQTLRTDLPENYVPAVVRVEGCVHDFISWAGGAQGRGVAPSRSGAGPSDAALIGSQLAANLAGG